MNVKEAAAQLNGDEYNSEGSSELFAAMKSNRLVAVYGASDDLMEFRGAIHDEVGAYEGASAFVTSSGLLENECGNDRCPHFAKLQEAAFEIEALWCDEDNISWTYRTSIPHETFLIKEDDETYCRGIVFSLDNLSAGA